MPFFGGVRPGVENVDSAVVKYHIPVALSVAGLLILNGCAAQRPIPTQRIQSGDLEEVLPPSTQVHLVMQSGEEIDGYVASTTDSTITLLRSRLDLVGGPNRVVVPTDEIAAMSLHVPGVLSRVLGGFIIGGIVVITALVIWIYVAFHDVHLQ